MSGAIGKWYRYFGTVEIIQHSGILWAMRIDPRHKAIVEAGGARYVAECNIPPDSVLFTSLETGSSLVLPARGLTPEAVRASIDESNRQFPPHQWRTHVRSDTVQVF